MTQDITHLLIEFIGEDEIYEKQSDDGEPSGTAGAPILNILKKKNLVNVLVVVTRYFGGILLGTGGLVKAYSEATIKGLEMCTEVEKEKGYEVEVIVSYEDQSKFEYVLNKNNINVVSKEYSEKVKNVIEISEEKFVELFRKNSKSNFHNFPIIIKENKYITKT